MQLTRQNRVKKEKISGILGELQSQLFFFDIDFVRKVYIPSEFKRIKGKAKQPVNAYTLFQHYAVTDDSRVVLMEIEDCLAGVVFDRIIRTIHNEEADVIHVSDIPSGHEFLIFDAVLTIQSEKVLRFSRSGLKKLLVSDNPYTFLWKR